MRISDWSSDVCSSDLLAALVVAPGLSEAAIVDALATQIDAAFLPRPLRKVAQLPRNALGKLQRTLLLATLGISGAWIANLTALEPYKPYVAMITLPLLGYGFWPVYFKPISEERRVGKECVRKCRSRW